MAHRVLENFGELDEPHPVYPSVEGFNRIVKLENDQNSPPDMRILDGSNL